MSGPAVTIVDTAGTPVVPVADKAPAMTLVASGGTPITPVSSNASPFVIEGVSPFATASESLFARFTTPPTPSRQVLINNLIVSLTAAGVWAKLDALYVMAAADAQSAQQNWIANLYNLTPVSAPTFTADRGYQGNGTTSYITTGYVMAAQNSNHMGIWCLTNNNVSASDAGSADFFMGVRNTGNFTTRNHASPSQTVAVPTSAGYSLMTRNAGASYSRYKNAVSLGDSATASAAPGASAVVLLARGTVGAPDSFSNRQLSVVHAGTGLTQQNVSDLYSSLSTYLQAVGAT